ncbi:hypothetical protein, partial [Mesorhizobium sp.]|uniref:hypothetical protein n=1 Tax=Mesorhizobium sp. TaxID=1871066 RepID=UPI0025DE8205
MGFIEKQVPIRADALDQFVSLVLREAGSLASLAASIQNGLVALGQIAFPMMHRFEDHPANAVDFSLDFVGLDAFPLLVADVRNVDRVKLN